MTGALQCTPNCLAAHTRLLSSCFELCFTPRRKMLATHTRYETHSSCCAGTKFNSSTDPSLDVFQRHQVAELAYDDSAACAVNDNKTDLSVHCSGQVQIPASLTPGMYTFLWHWIINNTSPTPVDFTLYLEYRFAFEVNVVTAM